MEENTGAAMGRTVKLEIQNSICNLRFLCGVLLIFCAEYIAEREHLQFLLEVGFSTEGPGWYAAFLYCTSSTNGLLFVPLMAPFAAGADAETEAESRFLLFSALRTGKKRYLFGKAMALAASGGLMAVLSMGLFLILGIAGFSQVVFSNYGEVAIGMILFETVLHLVRGFLNGAFWALLGGTSAVVTKNRYMACTIPFVLYYVLTVFQERYYRKLGFLNPRYWASPVYYSNLVCIGILLVLSLLMAALFVIVMKRRMEHA